MSHFRSVFLTVLSVIVVSACAASPQPAQTLEQKLASKGYMAGALLDSVRDYRLNGWNYVDRENIIMHSGVSDHYLVTLRSPCPDLGSANSIAFTSTVGNLTKRDKLIVEGPGGFVQHCLIDSLRELMEIERDVAAD